jgi:predicted kinase
MSKLQLSKPTIIMLYGYPGAGKTYFARQLCEDVQAAHVQADRIRYELFEEPRYDKQENDIVDHLMKYMTEEFLSAGISVVYDVNSMRLSQRRELRDMARSLKAQHLLIWFQIDAESAYQRANKRDRRKADDKYAMPINSEVYEQILGRMQNPTTTEDFIVISGKHTYTTQRNAVIKRLFDLSLVNTDATHAKMVKPELVNLIPNPRAGRVDNTRRNITIR